MDFNDFLRSLDVDKICYDAVNAAEKRKNLDDLAITSHAELFKLSNAATHGIIIAYLREYHSWLLGELHKLPPE